MPLFATNFYPAANCNHYFFAPFEAAGVPTMKFFVEPVVRAIIYALGELGYVRIVMSGLSGGQCRARARARAQQCLRLLARAHGGSSVRARVRVR